MHMMLQAVRALVSPSISQKERSVCQRRMNQSGLLQQLCTILMATGIPADVLTECINTVAEVIRGHPDNQVGGICAIIFQIEHKLVSQVLPFFYFILA